MRISDWSSDVCSSDLVALATPSWAVCEGGVDRARARQAFAADLPDAVIQRRLKGGPDGFALKIMRTQLPAIRERLLDGMLVREGIVDRPALEQSLNERNLMCGRDYTDRKSTRLNSSH